MIREYKTSEMAIAVAKEALYLAWIAAGGSQGIGFLQDKPSATKEDVWDNACNMGDYPGASRGTNGRINADYVFGRMLKLYFKMPSATSIDVPENKPRYDYQSWCGKYKSYADLFDAAEASITEGTEK